MVIYGTPIANNIAEKLRVRVSEMDVIPHLAIIDAGASAASDRYITKKIRQAQKIGMQASRYRFAEGHYDECRACIELLNRDTSVHGIIVQIPVYDSWPEEELISLVNPAKDVDGFLPESPFTEATALGIWEMIVAFARHEGEDAVEDFLQEKKIVVVGRGRTAGGPIARLLTSRGFAPQVIHSQTQDPEAIMQQADLIISATGKPGLIHAEVLKDGAYVIGAGVTVLEDDAGEKIVAGDLEETSVAEKARLYCPTKNGIGPLTVIFLLQNTVDAAAASGSSSSSESTAASA